MVLLAFAAGPAPVAATDWRLVRIGAAMNAADFTSRSGCAKPHARFVQFGSKRHGGRDADCASGRRCDNESGKASTERMMVEKSAAR